mmetsp:Transcript_17772/g.57570  ORF Transcript_17772/g.57570 Transcript_17772/m.57570 type:complete len:235 (-) Transcript_17772:724-1428(-)
MGRGTLNKAWRQNEDDDDDGRWRHQIQARSTRSRRVHCRSAPPTEVRSSRADGVLSSVEASRPRPKAKMARSIDVLFRRGRRRGASTSSLKANNSATPVEPVAAQRSTATDPSSRGCVVRRSGRVVPSAKRRRRHSSADPRNSKDAQRLFAADGEPRHARGPLSRCPDVTSPEASRSISSATAAIDASRPFFSPGVDGGDPRSGSPTTSLTAKRDPSFRGYAVSSLEAWRPTGE